MKFFIHFILVVLITFGCSVTKSTKKIHPYSGGSAGCGNFIIYKLTEDNTGYVSVVVAVPSIELEERQAYGIGKSEIVSVKRKQFDGPIGQTLCNDEIVENKPREILKEIADQGTVELVVSEVEQEKAKNNEPYKATVILRNVVFETVSIDYLRIANVKVGWLPG